MKFNCPKCSQRIQCDDALAGRFERCPSCNNRIQVPAVPPVAGEAADAAPADERRGAPAARVMRVKRREHAPSFVRTTSIGAGPSGTNVSAFATGLLGLGITVLFYLLILALRKTALGALFLDRGWVPVAEALLLWWSAAILLFKSKKLARQKQCMLFDILPEEIAPDITQESVGQFIEHARVLKDKAADSFLTNRVLKVLEHFRARNSNPEAATVLTAQSDFDANAVHSSYTLLRIFIWAIPILGFIGTVNGLGNAVGGFASGLEGAQDIAVLKDSLGKITVGLAVAFDTTLIALVMAIPLMFLMSAMQKAEEDLLNAIDAFCTENLLKRLKEKPSAFASGDNAEALARLLLESLGQAKDIQAAHTAACAKSDATQKDLAAVQDALAALQKREAEQRQQLADAVSLCFKTAVDQLAETLSQTGERQRELRLHAEAAREEVAAERRRLTAALDEGLAALNRSLERLGGTPAAASGAKQPWWKRLLVRG